MATILKIAGSDASAQIKAACDLVLNGATDVADLNTFLADKTVGIYTLNIYRTIYVSGFIEKKRNHNWQGKCGVIKMLPDLTNNYIGGILPEVGDHNYTYINDFELDGNEVNNIGADINALGTGICYHHYDDVVTPTIEYNAANIKLKNIHSHDWIKSCILPGSGWICRNIRAGNSRRDHILYISGAQNVNINRLYLYGYSEGALAISGASYFYNPTSPENIKIKELVLNECVTTLDSNNPNIHIRGRFQGAYDIMGLPCKNVTIDGIKVRNTVQFDGRTLFIGHAWDVDGQGGRCEDISLLNVDIDVVNFYSVMVLMRGKNLKISGVMNFKANATTVPRIYISGGGGFAENNYDLSDCDFTVQNYGTGPRSAVLGILENNDVNGLNLSNTNIAGADVIKRSNGTASILNFNTTDLVYDKELNPDAIEII